MKRRLITIFLPWLEIRRLNRVIDAITDVGVYPARSIGGDNPYEERTPRMEGWNDATREVIKRYAAACAVIILSCTLSSCTIDAQNGVFPSLVWAWSDEAKNERAIRAERRAAMDAKEKSQRDATQAGWDAFQKGLPEESNPYTGALEPWWGTGWSSAEWASFDDATQERLWNENVRELAKTKLTLKRND